MSDFDSASDGNLGASQPAKAPSGLSSGAQLRALREQRGWSQDEVSVRLKFAVRQIAALEDERWADLPQGMPLRGFVRNYARLLDTDPAPFLAALSPIAPPADTVAIDQVSFVPTPLARSRGRHWHTSKRRPAPWLIGGIMVILAAVLLGFALMKQGKLPFANGSRSTVAAAASPVAPPVVPDVPAGSVVETPVAPQIAPVPGAAVATPGAAAAAATSLPAAGAAPAIAPGGLALTMREASWAEVRRADGTVTVSRILQAGERYDLEASGAPLRVVVGNAKGVDLSWRGAAVDLTPYRRDNVARLTLQ